MMEAYIKAISYYLPEEVLSNEDINREFPEWSVDKISSKTGIYKRHIAGEGQTASDLGLEAAGKLFEEWQISGDSIDFLILCTQSPDYFLPTSACLMQHKLSLPEKCGAIDINMGCSGYIYGLSIAKGLISAGTAKNILLITAETYTKYIHPQDKSNRTIFGDAASATLISSDKEKAIGSIGNSTFGTDGAGYEHLIVRNGASRQPCRNGEDVFVDGLFHHNDNNLYMDGKAIFNFTALKVPPLIRESLAANSLLPDDISLYVFHQANEYMMNFIRKRIGIDPDKFYVYLRDVGNTVSSTIPIALYHAHRQKLLKGHIMLAGFGVGLSMGATILKCDF